MRPEGPPFLATATPRNTDYLVAESEDMFGLKEYEGTRIVTCAEFLAALRERYGRSPA